MLRTRTSRQRLGSQFAEFGQPNQCDPEGERRVKLNQSTLDSHEVER